MLQVEATDLRRDEGRTRISCLLAIASLGDGRASLSRLRLETPVITLVGGGHVDVVARRRAGARDRRGQDQLPPRLRQLVATNRCAA